VNALGTDLKREAAAARAELLGAIRESSERLVSTLLEQGDLKANALAAMDRVLRRSQGPPASTPEQLLMLLCACEDLRARQMEELFLAWCARRREEYHKGIRDIDEFGPPPLTRHVASSLVHDPKVRLSLNEEVACFEK
jgi:hypothetical protein